MEIVGTVMLDGEIPVWSVKNGRDTRGQSFILAETVDGTVGFTARNARELGEFANSLLVALRAHAEVMSIIERDPIGS